MGSLSLSHCHGLCGVQIKKWGLRKVVLSFPFGLPDSQHCRAPAFMVLSGHSYLTFSKVTWPRLFWGLICVKSLIDRLDIPPLSIEMFLVSHSWITLDCSACTQRQQFRNSKRGFKCVDRGDSSKRLTEGGQECEQGMLGNQQVLSCVCVWIPLCTKDRLWVIRGQVCTGNQMFSLVRLPVSSLHK